MNKEQLKSKLITLLDNPFVYDGTSEICEDRFLEEFFKLSGFDNVIETLNAQVVSYAVSQADHDFEIENIEDEKTKVEEELDTANLLIEQLRDQIKEFKKEATDELK